MSVSILDGTLLSVSLKRKTRRHSVYDRLVFRREDGSEEILAKAVVAPKVAQWLTEGASGRFYLYRSIDHKGVHALRLTDGRTIFDYPTVNERLMLLVLIVNCVMLLGRLAIDGMIWILPLLLIVFAAIVYPLYRKTHIEARDQFNKDQSGVAPRRSP